MKKVIVNTALDKLRQRKLKRKIKLIDQDHMFKTTDHDEIYNFESEQEQQKSTNIIMEAIARLSPAYRLVFNMYVIEEYTHAEIANELGISEGTSKSNLFKAKANLKKALKNKIEFVY
jgi:RNA polymerase sigma-70 factor (ECF subfamily)